VGMTSTAEQRTTAQGNDRNQSKQADKLTRHMLGAVLSVVMGEAISRMVSMVLGRYRASASVGDQLEHLGMLVILQRRTPSLRSIGSQNIFSFLS